ncbi:MAG: DinB family protein [Acidobacteria bacterium]|nr:MAG: DinB family protein [Acidobacteriota bacterium]
MTGTSAIPTLEETHETVRLLERSRDELVAHCAALSPTDWARSDGPGRWTQAGILEHLLIVERGIQKRMEAILAGPADPDWEAHTTAKDAVAPEVAQVTERVMAPERLHPTGKAAPAESLAAFQAARAQTIALAQQPGVPFKQYTFEHPALGLLNGFQVLRVTAYHTLRHLGQMRGCSA